MKHGLSFLGLQGMIDPPRAEAIASVRKCQRARIQVKMITGDHALTAHAIARQLGLAGGGKSELVAVSGRELTTFLTRNCLSWQNVRLFLPGLPQNKSSNW